MSEMTDYLRKVESALKGYNVSPATISRLTL
jgi:hypothetical protein